MSRILLPCVAATLALAACGGGEKPADQPAAQALASNEAAATPDLPPDVAHAVAIARGIEAHPTAADSILAAHGVTRAGLDSMMYAIAADSAKAAAYTAALR